MYSWRSTRNEGTVKLSVCGFHKEFITAVTGMRYELGRKLVNPASPHKVLSVSVMFSL